MAIAKHILQKSFRNDVSWLFYSQIKQTLFQLLILRELSYSSDLDKNKRIMLESVKQFSVVVINLQVTFGQKRYCEMHVVYLLSKILDSVGLLMLGYVVVSFLVRIYLDLFIVGVVMFVSLEDKLKNCHLIMDHISLVFSFSL